MIHKLFSHSLYSATLKGKMWAKIEMTAFLTWPCDSQLSHRKVQSKESQLVKVNVDIMPCPDNWFIPCNTPDNDTVFTLHSLAGVQGFLSNALSLSP